MSEFDARTTKLDWIRDAMKWVVGIAAGLLGLSATYFYDRFDQAPQLAGALWFAWVLLIVASLAGIFAALATWKNVGTTGELGSYLTWCYTIAMYSFTLGFLTLAVVLMTNVASSRKANGVADFFAVGGALPSFDPASATPSDPRFILAACAARQVLADSGSFSALVVGRFDQRELSSRAQSRFATNLELAQSRADRIGEFLTDTTLCKGRPMHHVVTLTGGPRQSIPLGATGADADAKLAADRRVEVYGFQMKRR